MDSNINCEDSSTGKNVGKSVGNVICPVCSNIKESRFLCKIKDYSIYSCNHCCAEYVFPAPSNAALKAYYDRKEWFEGGEEGGYQDYDAQTEWSLELIRSILNDYDDLKGLSILDVGCGYGTHLALAADRGWKCFGVEISGHARGVAQSRLGGAAYVVESISDLIPHEFDLVLMLDVIEHLHSPYSLFYSLFSIGAITSKTRIVITTPNAGSLDATRNPVDWTYRHPPSHLVFYTAESLSFLLKRLHFNEVEVRGLHPIVNSTQDSKFESFAGLLVSATGSDFAEFMRERYVPGTWSKVAEYEHLPRYIVARNLAEGKQVLDFGCGTGYGAAMLAGVATSVTGLDIDVNAHNWARECHHNPSLQFHLCDDLGATLASESFDLVTCFEMIEHVDHATQKSTIASIARLLRDDGVLVISTPNPEVTKLYGENPYHLREMTEGEFLELLSEQFPYVTLLKQSVRVSITFEGLTGDRGLHTESLNSGRSEDCVAPLAYIALCSKNERTMSKQLISFDNDTDFIHDFIERENKLHNLRFTAYQSAEQVTAQGSQLASYRMQIEQCTKQASSIQVELAERDQMLSVMKSELAERDQMISAMKSELAERDQIILTMRNSKIWRLTKPFRILNK